MDHNTASGEQLRPNTGRFEPFRSAGLLPVFAFLVPLSILAVVGWLSWQSVWKDAENDMHRAAGSAAEYGERTLEGYSLAAGRVNDRLRGLSDEQIRTQSSILHVELKRIAAELAQSEVISVLDRNGRMLLASNMASVPQDVAFSDQDYFKAFDVPSPPALYISRTFLEPLDKRPLFSVSRPRRDTGNPASASGFDGVVLVSISPHVLANGMRRLLSANTDRMALMRADGYGISTTSGLSDLNQPLPRVDAGSPFYGFSEGGSQSAIYISGTATPGSSSLLAMRLIDGLPIYAVSIRPVSEIVARWWSIMATHLAFGLPASIGLLLLSLRVVRDQHRLAVINAELMRANDLSADRLFRAKRFGFVGTFELDPRTGRSRQSAEYMSVHGVAAIAAEETEDAWAERLHPDDRERAVRELKALLSNPQMTDYAQTYRIVTPAGDIRWIAARGEITRDAKGDAVTLLGAHVDVTPLRSTELALAESDARLRLVQEAVGLGTWEWTSETRSLKVSPRMLELCGFDIASGMPGLKAMLSCLHEDDRQVFRNMVKRARRVGACNGEFRILRPSPEGDPETRWVALRAMLLTSPELAHPVLMGITYDITEQKRAEELTILMAHEVEHRSKNALSVVLSLLRMTKADSAEQLAQVMEGRVMALSQTMALLGHSRWQGADMRDIVIGELTPFEQAAAGDSSRISLAGPPIIIDVNTAQPLAMALHELATNAAKYGALSVPSGILAVEWRVEDDWVHLSWQERGGPRLDGPPPRAGFGSRLITMLFEGQIGGKIINTWEPSGLTCEMSFQLRS